MDNLAEDQDKELDVVVSAFADLVLSGKQTMMETQLAANQAELAKLQDAVLQMKAAAQQARPDADVSLRIQKSILAEWQKVQPRQKTALERFSDFWTFPRLALAVGLLALVVIFSQINQFSNNVPLMGTAQGFPGGSLALIVIVGAAVVAALIWFKRNH
jgi:uncharacterized integral membrane protein